MEKWSFLNQKHGLTPLEKWQFFDVLNFFFYSLERRFFVLEYRKTHVPSLYCLKKKKLKKGPFLDQNRGLTPLEKCQFFAFLIFSFLEHKKAFFRCRIWSKTFSWPILTKKKEVGKMVIFGPKPWVNLYGKMAIFRLFELFVPLA